MVLCSFFARSFVVAALAAACGSTWAQQFPTKPIRWISPFAPGGGADLTTRIVAQRVSELVSQPVIVDNRIGASGNIGGELAARAPADGYTLLTVTASFPPSHAVSTHASFDLLRDLTYISQLTAQPYVLVVHPSVQATTVKELVAAAQRAPGTLHYGSSGIATLQHLAGVLFGSLTKTDLVHVPYRGGALALNDTVGGRLQLFFGVSAATAPHVKAGRLRALAVTSSERSRAHPELPTIAESGVRGYVVDNWYGVAAPAKTPPALVTKLNEIIIRALKTPELTERLRRDGAEPAPTTPAAFTATVRGDLERWRKQVKESGIKPES
jgi:tripartite-type tricarboxylate transporter receptor subunit TctC